MMSTTVKRTVQFREKGSLATLCGLFFSNSLSIQNDCFKDVPGHIHDYSTLDLSTDLPPINFSNSLLNLVVFSASSVSNGNRLQKLMTPCVKMPFICFKLISY